MRRSSTVPGLLLTLGYGTGNAARLTDAIEAAERALEDPALTDKKREDATKHLQGLNSIARQLTALWVHWQETSNNYFAIEAHVLAWSNGFCPPAWIPRALQAGFSAHLEKPGRDLSLQLGLRRRGTGKTQPATEYKARRKWEPAMNDMWFLCETFGVSAEQAAPRVARRHGLSEKAATIAKKYRQTWRPFYLSFGFGPDQLSPKERRDFLRSYPDCRRV